jgi:hypothetical protein
VLGDDFLFDRFGFGGAALVAQFFDDQKRGVLVDHLVDRGHHTHFHQAFDHLTSLDSHALRQIADRDVFRHRDFADNWRGWF